MSRKLTFGSLSPLVGSVLAGTVMLPTLQGTLPRPAFCAVPGLPRLETAVVDDMDWDELELLIQFLCILFPCPSSAVSQQAVEDQIKARICSYQTNGIYADLSPEQLADGRDTIEHIVQWLDSHPGALPGALELEFRSALAAMAGELAAK